MFDGDKTMCKKKLKIDLVLVGTQRSKGSI